MTARQLGDAVIAWSSTVNQPPAIGEGRDEAFHRLATAGQALAQTALDFLHELKQTLPEPAAGPVEKTWTVMGYWEEDEPVVTGVIEGQHEVTGEVDYERHPQGLWATSVEAEGADAAESAAVAEMLDTLASDRSDD